MTLKQALDIGKERLSGRADVDDPAFESEVLLRYVLQISRAQFFVDLDRELARDKENLFQEWVTRRSLGEPVAYILGSREFFGLDFYVDRRVLIPRPETELLVEEALGCSRNFKNISSHDKIIIADIGTGSGAVAVSLAVNLPRAQIYATDISAPALEVASINVRKHNVAEQVTLLRGDLLGPLPVPVNILVANLPYVARKDWAQMPSAQFEPTIALDGGQNGLDKIFQLCRQLKVNIRSPGCVLLEIGLGQDKAVIALLRQLFSSSEIETLTDLAGINRALKLTLPSSY